MDEPEVFDKLPPEISLHRMVHPNHNKEDEGRLTSACLRPTRKDEKKLSVDRGDFSQPRDSFERFVDVEKLSAIGVLTVAHSLCIKHDLPGYYWPLASNKAHSFIDFRPYTDNQIQKRARRLFIDAWKECNEEFSYKPAGSASNNTDEASFEG